eukprot:5289090-Pyramimonas_sp.AAC.1
MAWQQAVIDIELLAAYCKGASKRRSAPSWAQPLGMWATLLSTPSEKDGGSRLGLGADRTSVVGVFLRGWLQIGLAMIRYWGSMPTFWNCSQ